MTKKYSKPCDDPNVRMKLDCFDFGEKKCYGHLLYGSIHSSAQFIRSLGKCHWIEYLADDLKRKGVDIK